MAILVTYKQASINFERRWSSLGGLPLATNVALVENTAMANCRWSEGGREGGREGWRMEGGREGGRVYDKCSAVSSPFQYYKVASNIPAII